MVLLHGGVDGAQLGASLIESGAGSETAEELGHAMDAAGDHGGGKVMRAGDDVGDDFGVLGIGDAGFEDADDGRRRDRRCCSRRTVLPMTEGSFLKSGRPETVGENDDAGGVGTVVLRSDEATEDGMKAHDVEVGAADDAASNFDEAHRGRSW